MIFNSKEFRRKEASKEFSRNKEYSLIYTHIDHTRDIFLQGDQEEGVKELIRKEARK